MKCGTHIVNWDKNGVNQGSFILSPFGHFLSDIKIIDDIDNYWNTQSRSVNLKEKIKGHCFKKKKKKIPRIVWPPGEYKSSQCCEVSDKTTK